MDTGQLVGDILAERRLTREELSEALSSLFSVSPDNIIAFEDWQELQEDSDRTRILCRYWHIQGGEFHTVIDLPDSLLHSLPRNPTALRLAELLGCRLLVCEETVNPYSFLLYGSNGNFEPVFIEPEASNRNEFVILRW